LAKKLTIALAGNPNSGKTTIFNNLTGAHKHVGNWPGVTVAKREGTCKYNDYKITIVDLPGTYSLTAYSLDERIARNFVLEEGPDMVVNIIDASNLERNLYLTTQFIELELPLIICLNKSDLAESHGYKINTKQLTQFIGLPVVSTVGHRNQGTDNLLDTIVKLASGEINFRKMTVGYGKEIQDEISKIEDLIQKNRFLKGKYPSRWLAVKLLEGDKEMTKLIDEKNR